MKKEWPIEVGRIVRSKAGRDAGRYFVITALDGKEFVFVADGRKRRIEAPKRKRVKHLYVTEETISSLQCKLNAGEKVENFEIREELRAFTQKEE